MATTIGDYTADVTDDFSGTYGRGGWEGVSRKIIMRFTDIDSADVVLAAVVDYLINDIPGGAGPWAVHPDLPTMYVATNDIRSYNDSGINFEAIINYNRVAGNIETGDPEDPTSYLDIANSHTVIQGQTSYDAAGNLITVSYQDGDANDWPDQPGIATVENYLDTITLSYMRTTNSASVRGTYINQCNSASWTPPGRTISDPEYAWKCVQFDDERVEDSLYRWRIVFQKKEDITIDGTPVFGWEQVKTYIDPDTGNMPTKDLPDLSTANGAKIVRMNGTADFNNIPLPTGF